MSRGDLELGIPMRNAPSFTFADTNMFPSGFEKRKMGTMCDKWNSVFCLQEPEVPYRVWVYSKFDHVQLPFVDNLQLRNLVELLYPLLGHVQVLEYFKGMHHVIPMVRGHFSCIPILEKIKIIFLEYFCVLQFWIMWCSFWQLDFSKVEKFALRESLSSIIWHKYGSD